MSEKHLLLQPTKQTLFLTSPVRKTVWLQILFAIIGTLVVLVGAADIATRTAHQAFGSNASLVAFGPAIALTNTSDTNTSIATSSDTVIIPTQLLIPSIGLKAPVEQVGNKADGTMGTPKNFTDVAWYSLGSKPGQLGNAVIDGHVNNALTTSGVFEHLIQLKAGDMISVSGNNGSTLRYHVVKVAEYNSNDAPTSEIFSTTGPSQLVLITCAGDWISQDHSFNKRLVVYAQLN